MLPDCHCIEQDYQVPQFNVVTDEVEDFYERLRDSTFGVKSTIKSANN